MAGDVPSDWRKTNIAPIAKKAKRMVWGAVSFGEKVTGSPWNSEKAAAWINQNGLNNGK